MDYRGPKVAPETGQSGPFQGVFPEFCYDVLRRAKRKSSDASGVVIPRVSAHIAAPAAPVIQEPFGLMEINSSEPQVRRPQTKGGGLLIQLHASAPNDGEEEERLTFP